MAQVFISYSHRDGEFVNKLVSALVAENRDVWLDEKDIEVTAEWLKEIFSNIEAADNFLFVISPDSVASTYARKEIDHASLNNKRMVPIYCRTVPDADIPEAVARFQRIDFTGTTEFDPNFAKLIKALDTDLDWKQAHTRLLTRAWEWEREGKDRSFLLRGKDLIEAEHWIVRGAEKEPKPTTLHSQYILASRQSATKTQRIIIGAVAIALVVAIGLAIYAFSQRNTARSETKEAQRNARESKAREFAAFATESLSVDPERSILLGMQAVNVTLQFNQPSVPAAEDVLHQAILSSQVRKTLKGHVSNVLGVAWSPDGKRLATASWDRTAKVWDAASGQELLTLKGHTGDVNSVAWSPDGKRLATASGDWTAKVWDAASGQELLTLKGHTGRVNSVAWSPDGKRLATASDDKTAKMWDAVRGQELLTLKGHTYSVNSVAWSPDGKRLATASCDRTAKVWDAASGQELLTLKGHSKGMSSVTWSPDGKRLATASIDQTANVWSATSGQELLSMKGHTDTVLGVAWSPDGKRLATASTDQTAKVWDAASGQQLLTLEGHTDRVESVVWSPDGKRLATASSDLTAKVWDAANGHELLTLKGHPAMVESVAWSSDGKRLATASFDGTAKVWDSADGRELFTLKGHTGIVNSAAWSPDGKRLATASDDQTVQIYTIDVRELLDQAHKRVTRDFTLDECERYFQSATCPPMP